MSEIRTSGGAIVVNAGSIVTNDGCCELCFSVPYCDLCYDENGTATGWSDGTQCLPLDQAFVDACYWWTCFAWPGQFAGCHPDQYLVSSWSPETANVYLSVWAFGKNATCPHCPEEPTHTLCCPSQPDMEPGCVPGYGPGPVQTFGVPPALGHLALLPGEACDEYAHCDAGTGACTPNAGWYRSSQVPFSAVLDCDECIAWCDEANDCEFVYFGKAATAPNLSPCDACNPLP